MKSKFSTMFGATYTRRLLLPLLLIAVLGYVLGWSTLLDVRTIEVSGIKGATTLTKKKVIEASGIRKGDKLARLNAGVVARGLSEYPEVEKVELNRKPLHTVEIAIRLRSIDVALRQPNGKFLLGDVNGVTFVEVSRVPKGVPIISGDRRFLIEAMNIYDGLSKKLKKRVLEIALPSSASITLRLRGGLTILWGGAGDQEAKLTVLEALLAAPENKRATFIDIATPLTPTVR